MDLSKKENTTRRKFVKGVISVTVYSCACLSFDSLAFSVADKSGEGRGKEYLASACGTYCGACPAYLAKHGDEKEKKLRLEKRNSSAPQKPMNGIPDPGLDGWTSLRRLSKRRNACSPLPDVCNKEMCFDKTE